LREQRFATRASLNEESRALAWGVGCGYRPGEAAFGDRSHDWKLTSQHCSNDPLPKEANPGDFPFVGTPRFRKTNKDLQ